MTSAEYVVDVLGGPGVFRSTDIPTAADLRDGIPYRSFESMRERLRLSVPETASVLHMPPRTLARRKQFRRLDIDESDRLYRIARIAAHAFAVLGSEEKAASWLHRPNRALGGEVLIHLLDTDVGVRHVEDVLGRIEYGIIE